MKDPNRPFVCTLLILLGLLFIVTPIMIPAFKIQILTWIDATGQAPEYSEAGYNLFWLLAYLTGTSTGVILIGYGAIRILRMVKKEKYRVNLD